RVSLVDDTDVVRPFSASASRANFSVTSVQVWDSTPVNGRNDSPQNGVPQRPQPKEKPQNYEQLTYQFAYLDRSLVCAAGAGANRLLGCARLASVAVSRPSSQSPARRWL